jgi:hypothetical protein
MIILCIAYDLMLACYDETIIDSAFNSASRPSFETSLTFFWPGLTASLQTEDSGDSTLCRIRERREANRIGKLAAILEEKLM